MYSHREGALWGRFLQRECSHSRELILITYASPQTPSPNAIKLGIKFHRVILGWGGINI